MDNITVYTSSLSQSHQVQKEGQTRPLGKESRLGARSGGAFTFPLFFCSSAPEETSRPSGWTPGSMLESGLHKLLHCGQQIRSFCLKFLDYFVFLGSDPT